MSDTPLALIDYYDKIVLPLFSLPRRLPITAWSGHIPFLFTLFRVTTPSRYLELGVHTGASLIAAATAASSYNVGTEVIGVDTWQGDDHAGKYQGDAMFAELLEYTNRSFKRVELIRSLFSEAKPRFPSSSIDILHIDGLHTYEAVKEDYETWADAVRPGGIILFHDTAVRERNFGVWKLWQEISANRPHLEFTHSHGLGVLFTGTIDDVPLPLRKLVSDPALFDVYRNLASEIGELVPSRCAYLADQSTVPVSDSVAPSDLAAELRKAQVAADFYREQLNRVRGEYENSRSWKLTAPIRKIVRAIRP